MCERRNQSMDMRAVACRCRRAWCVECAPQPDPPRRCHGCQLSAGPTSQVAGTIRTRSGHPPSQARIGARSSTPTVSDRRARESDLRVSNPPCGVARSFGVEAQQRTDPSQRRILPPSARSDWVCGKFRVKRCHRVAFATNGPCWNSDSRPSAEVANGCTQNPPSVCCCICVGMMTFDINRPRNETSTKSLLQQ